MSYSEESEIERTAYVVPNLVLEGSAPLAVLLKFESAMNSGAKFRFEREISGISPNTRLIVRASHTVRGKKIFTQQSDAVVPTAVPDRPKAFTYQISFDSPMNVGEHDLELVLLDFPMTTSDDEQEPEMKLIPVATGQLKVAKPTRRQ